MSPARKRQVPDERRKGDQRSAAPRRKGDRVRRRADQLLVLVGLACVIVGWVSLQHQSSRVTDVVTQIQQQRKDNIRANCLDQNARHDTTISRLQSIARDNHVDAKRIAPTISLVDRLAPKRDCEALVAEQTNLP